MRKVFYSLGASCYGDRIYIATKDTNSRLGDLLKAMSAWGGSDKQDLEEKWISFEMPPSNPNDKDLYKNIISACLPGCFVTQGNLKEWEYFLFYCKEA